MGVASQHPDYAASITRWNRCEDVAKGTDAVHAGAETYLPRLKFQDTDDYAAYVARTPFFNATWRTIAGLSGMVFRKPAQVEVPAGVVPMLDDITMAGESLTMFAQTLLIEVLTKGRAGVLCDYPRNEEGSITVAQAESMGLRPMLKLYKAASVYNWRMGRVNNELMLTEVRLMEDHATADGEWDIAVEQRYRVLDLHEGAYRVRVYKVDEATQNETLLEEFTPLKAGKSLTRIPFQFFGTDDTTPKVSEPPLIDLVDMNLHHYRTSAIKCNALPFAVPTMFIAGQLELEAGEKISIGSRYAIHSNDPNAKASYVEWTGAAMSPLEKEIDKVEQQMAVLGARMLEAQRKAAESADSQSIHRKGEESVLAAIAVTVGTGLTNVLTWFCEWAGQAGDVKCVLNRDFYPVGMTPQMLTSLLSAWQQGAISDQTLFYNLHEAEVQPADTTFEEEDARTGGFGGATDLTAPATQDAAGGTATQQATQPQPVDYSAAIEGVTTALDAILTKVSEPQQPPVINMPAPVINLPAITVEAPVINLPPNAPVVVNNMKSDVGTIIYDAEGNIIGWDTTKGGNTQ